MPIYKYNCSECDFSDEYIRSMEARDRTPLCRACGAETSRIISFTGTVWAPTSGGMK